MNLVALAPWQPWHFASTSAIRKAAVQGPVCSVWQVYGSEIESKACLHSCDAGLPPVSDLLRLCCRLGSHQGKTTDKTPPPPPEIVRNGSIAFMLIPRGTGIWVCKPRTLSTRRLTCFARGRPGARRSDCPAHRPQISAFTEWKTSGEASG
ncbi:hypothetical protein GQ53DRAFT_389745 [Thozetella sp. PMI_491]|nr:hypothetical protein GQ53DRAFT_389745 [Thozetella sp. PMI_491]